MPQPQQQQEQSWIIPPRNAFNIGISIVNVYAMCLLPFTRSRMGTRGIGVAGFWAMLVIPLYAGQTRSPEMLAYWYVWLAMVIYQRIRADKYQHTDFQGFVWAFDWLIKDELWARRLEALSMFFLGSLLTDWSEPVGQFVFFSGYVLLARTVIDTMLVTRQKEAAHNARVEMETMQRRFEQERRSNR